MLLEREEVGVNDGVSVHGTLKLEIGNLALTLLYCRIMSDFIFYHESTKHHFHLILFSCFGLFGLS